MRTISFGKPIIGSEEKQAVLEVLNGPILTHGPRVKEFEAAFSKYLERNSHSLAVSSCTAALHLSYFYLNIKSGDEIIVPALTHTATAHAVELCNGTPVFVDSEKETGNININLIENYINEKTKAISIVHFLGMPVDMDSVNNIAKKYNLFVVEDCALAIGTYYKGIHAGLLGDMGCFSFYPVKHMTTGEGGMFVTKHAAVADKINKQRAFGIDRHINERKIPSIYDVEMLGFNYRMSELQAALGIEQLKRIHGFLKKRKENYERLKTGFEEITEIELLQSSKGHFESSYYCFSVILINALASKRYDIVKRLNENGIQTSVYYPQPVPKMTYYKNRYKFKDDSFPIASRISNQTISLSVAPHLELEDMEYMVEIFKKVLREV